MANDADEEVCCGRIDLRLGQSFPRHCVEDRAQDRKSTRLNSSHGYSSYAVFRLKKKSWGDHEIVTLASIVEKETAAKHERPLIAGVFLNRMKFSSFKPKRLETDPTIVYGCTVPEKKSAECQKLEGRIRRIHLDDKDNPYSTYAIEGLPPGPISNPGKEALEAVLALIYSRSPSSVIYTLSLHDALPI